MTRHTQATRVYAIMTMILRALAMNILKDLYSYKTDDGVIDSHVDPDSSKFSVTTNNL